MQGDLSGAHLQGDGRVAVVRGVVDGLGQHVVLGGGAVAEGDLRVVVRAGMTCMAALSTSTSSMAGQAETTRLGDSGP